jgi:plasmid stabilization system protein ParE
MVKRTIIWSPRAKIDLFNILDFYFQRNGTKTYSIKLNGNLRKSIRLLETHPEIGVKSDIENVRNLIHGNYEIFYEIKIKTIEIITIWDCKQDPEKLKIK